MAWVDTDKHWPAQWRRLIEGDGKSLAWGNPIPLRSALSGKTAEEIRSWAASCTAKISFYLAKIPEGDLNDGYWEVRCYWHSQRKTWLLQEAATLQTTPVRVVPSIRPMIPTPGGYPGALPASITSTPREEKTDNGTGPGEASRPETIAGETSPPVEEDTEEDTDWSPPLSLPTSFVQRMMLPFKRPRPAPPPREENIDSEEDELLLPRRSKRLKQKAEVH